MDKKRITGEKLLDAWLKLSSTVWNSRVVSTMTFNETYVCNLLHHQMENNPETRLTATDLCEKMGLFKSQMNKVLKSMEESGYIKKVRSEKDKRFVYIEITEKGLAQYKTEHEEVMKIMDRLVDKIGYERTEATAKSVNDISDEFISYTRGENK